TNLSNYRRQYVYSGGWGSYVDDMILRDMDTDANSGTGNYGFTGSGLDQRLYVHHDSNHNVTSIADVSGTVQERFVYDSYGKSVTLDASYATPGATNVTAIDWSYKYQGGRLDNDIQLYQFRARNYSPTLGRWVEQDPAQYID